MSGAFPDFPIVYETRGERQVLTFDDFIAAQDGGLTNEEIGDMVFSLRCFEAWSGDSTDGQPYTIQRI